jgi:hypothetical protein
MPSGQTKRIAGDQVEMPVLIAAEHGIVIGGGGVDAPHGSVASPSATFLAIIMDGCGQRHHPS